MHGGNLLVSSIHAFLCYHDFALDSCQDPKLWLTLENIVVEMQSFDDS